MRHVLGVFGVLAAAVLLAVSASMNYKFGYSLGRTDADGHIYGVASAAADCLKALVPFFFFAAWRNRAWSQAGASAVLWSVVTVYGLTSALGHASINRADTAGTRVVASNTYADLTGKLKRLDEQLAWIPQHRPAGAVAAEIANMKTQKPYQWSEKCTAAGDARKFCDKLASLEGEFASSNSADGLLKEADNTRAAIAALGATGAAAAGADPQAATLTALIGKVFPGVKQADVTTALTVLVAVLLEVGSGFGMYCAFATWGIFDPAPRGKKDWRAMGNDLSVKRRLEVMDIPVADNSNLNSVPAVAKKVNAGSVKDFLGDRVTKVAGMSQTNLAMYEAYCNWCEEAGKDPVKDSDFGTAMARAGINKAAIAGRVRWMGVVLKRTTAAAPATNVLPMVKAA